MDISIATVDFAVAEPLRLAVLRTPDPADPARLQRLRDPAGLHLGAWLDGRLASVVSLVPASQDASEDGGGAEGQHRLCAMATAPWAQGQGVGSALVGHGLSRLAAAGGRLVWCDGRTVARNFYLRLGFRTVGAEFITATGPHWRFIRDLP